MISLMHAVDPLAHCAEMKLYLNKLISIDPLRANYYTDLRKNFVTLIALLCEELVMFLVHITFIVL